MVAHSRTAPFAIGAQTPEPLARSTLVVWFVGFAGLVFAIPAIATEWLEMHHDLYYFIYGSLVVLYLTVFVNLVGTNWLRDMFKRNLGWSLALGVLVAAASVNNVLSDTSTPHPDGTYFAFELVWRGLFYGLIDALALFVFPALVAYLLMNGNRQGIGRKVAFGALTLALTLTVTATYHLGYPQFRNSDLANPETGALMMSVPAVITGNPAGALIAHSAVHVTAVAHEYGGHDPGFLPPKLDGYRDRWGGTTAWLLAALWAVIIATAIWISRRWLFRHTRPTDDRSNA